MLRISITFFYELGARIRPLGTLRAGHKLNDVWPGLYAAQQQIEALFGTDWFLPAVKSSYAPGQSLLDALKEITSQTDWAKQLEAMEVFRVTNALADFEGALRAELDVADAFFVTRKAGYDTVTLMMFAEQLFPKDLPIKVPAAIPDVREAGKCLAYEASTAAGFHAFRAVEAVLRRYWQVTSGDKPPPKQRTIGAYVDEMDKHMIGDAKVRGVLRQVKDLHRNPINHPEETLTLEDAIGAFGIAVSAIGAMLKGMPDQEPTSGLLGALPQ